MSDVKEEAGNNLTDTANELAEFGSGFNDKPLINTEPAITVEKVDAAVPEQREPVQGYEEAASKVVAPVSKSKIEHIRITKSEWDELKAKAAEVATLKEAHQSQLSKAFGKIGTIEQVLNELRTKSSGEVTQITDEDMADLRKDYPELANSIAKAFNAAAKRGYVAPANAVAAPAVAAPKVISSDDVTKMVEQTVEIKMLDRAVPNWRLLGNSTEFQTWLNSNPTQKKTFDDSWDSGYIASVFKNFEEAEAAKKAPANAAPAVNSSRKARLEAAVQPRGTPGNIPAQKTDLDEFNEGFGAV